VRDTKLFEESCRSAAIFAGRRATGSVGVVNVNDCVRKAADP
jgi:hypothetical protein